MKAVIGIISLLLLIGCGPLPSDKVLSAWEVDKEVRTCRVFELEPIVVESWKGVHTIYCVPGNAKAYYTIDPK